MTDSDPDDDAPRETDDDRAFEDIVSNLGMSFDFPVWDPPVDLDDIPDDREDQFYRNVPPALPRTVTPRKALAFAAVVGPPILMVICTLFRVWMPRTLVFACGLIFVSGAIWWIAQLPEHGPGRPDWPDDGAEL